VENFKYLGTLQTNENWVPEEIKGILNCGSAYYYSIQNLLSSRLLLKDVKIKMYKIIIFPVFCIGMTY
jgi:hypothetical protein